MAKTKVVQKDANRRRSPIIVVYEMSVNFLINTESQIKKQKE